MLEVEWQDALTGSTLCACWRPLSWVTFRILELSSASTAAPQTSLSKINYNPISWSWNITSTEHKHVPLFPCSASSSHMEKTVIILLAETPSLLSELNLRDGSLELGPNISMLCQDAHIPSGYLWYNCPPCGRWFAGAPKGRSLPRGACNHTEQRWGTFALLVIVELQLPSPIKDCQ